MSFVSGIVGAVMGSDSQDNATAQAAQTNKDAQAMQKQMYDEQIAREKPFYDTGVQANSNLNKLVNGGYDMRESPSAQYQLTQGTKSLNRQLAARGLLGSGNAAQRLAELSSGIAASDYDKQYSRLLDQIKIGTGASASAGASGNTLSGQIGQNAANLGNIQMQSGANRAALYSGMGAQSTNAAATGLKAYGAYTALQNMPTALPEVNSGYGFMDTAAGFGPESLL